MVYGPNDRPIKTELQSHEENKIAIFQFAQILVFGTFEFGAERFLELDDLFEMFTFVRHRCILPRPTDSFRSFPTKH
jgi:hypothetical protein